MRRRYEGPWMEGRMVGDVKKGWEIGTQSSIRKETNTLASNQSTDK